MELVDTRGELFPLDTSEIRSIRSLEERHHPISRSGHHRTKKADGKRSKGRVISYLEYRNHDIVNPNDSRSFEGEFPINKNYKLPTSVPS